MAFVSMKPLSLQQRGFHLRQTQEAPGRRGLVVRAAKKASESTSLAPTSDAMVFRPFEEVKPQLAVVGETALNVPSSSFARVDYATSLEAAVNEQVNVEYNISYVYHALFAYFDRGGHPLTMPN